MVKYTKEFWDSIECESGCANCCVNSCKHLTRTNKCDVHPKKLGVSPQEAEKHGRGMGCHSSPLQLFTYAVYCPPVAKVIEKEGVKIDHYKTSQGVEVINNFQEVMEKSRKLRGF